MRPFENWFVGVPWFGAVLFQVTLVAVLGVIAWIGVRRCGPALRSAVLLAALVGVLVVPAVGTCFPVWLPVPAPVSFAAPQETSSAPRVLGPGPGLPGMPLPAPTSPKTEPTPLALKPFPEEPASLPVAEQTQQSGKGSSETVAKPDAGSEAAVPPGLTEEPAGKLWTVGEILVGVWLLGVLGGVLTTVRRLGALQDCRRRALPLSAADRAACWDGLVPDTGLARTVDLRESAAVISPLTLGLWQPVILLPLTWRSWSAGQRGLILAHELAHVRRRDFAAGLLAELARCVYWFHPLVSWLAGKFRLEQEFTADAWVASAEPGAKPYVCCLARLALEMDRSKTSLAPAMWRRRPEILRRIDMLRRNPGQAARLGRGLTFVVALLALAAFAAVAGIGHLQATADAQKTTPPQAKQPDQAKTDLQGDPLPPGARARMGTLRWRHGDTVTFVGFSGEGKGVVTASQDGTIRLWDRETGKEIRQFKGPALTQNPPLLPRRVGGGGGFGVPIFGNQPVLALSRDGKVLAVAYINQDMRLWDVATGKEIRQIKTIPAMATLLFAPDGKTLVGRGGDGSTFVWETETGKELRQIQVPLMKPGVGRVVMAGRGRVSGVAISADGKTLATAEMEFDQGKISTYLKLTALDTGKERRKTEKTTEGVSSIAYSPNGKLLAYGSGNNILLCEAETLKEIRRINQQGGIKGLVFAPNGKTLAAKGWDQAIRLWETDSGKELQQFGAAVPLGGGNVVVFSPFGMPEMRDFAFSLDGKVLASGAGQTLRMWEVATGKELPLTGGHRGPVTSLAITPDGKTLVTRGADNSITRWDVATGKELGQFQAPQGTSSATFAPDGRTVALVVNGSTIRLFEVKTGKELHKLKGHANGTNTLAFSPNGKVLASRGNDNTIHLYDMAKGSDLRQIQFTTDKVMANPGGGFGGYGFSGSMALVFSPDGETLVGHVPGTNNIMIRPVGQPGVPEPVPDTLRLWNVATGKEIRRIKLLQPGTLSVAYAPDGRVLATENADQTISLWEIASGKERGRFGKPNQMVPPGVIAYPTIGRFGRMATDSSPTLAFSPDGGLLAAKGPANAVSVWDVVGGKTLGQFKGHDGAIAALAFAPDGKSLATGSNDTTALVWDLAGLKREPNSPTVALEPKEMQALWTDLMGTDSGKAFQGILRLSRSPKQTVVLLGEQLKPAVPVDPKVLDQLVADLNSKNFQTRNKATAELEKLGELAVPALQKVMLSRPSLETQRRVEVLLEKLTGGILTAEQIRLVRAVEVLERLGTAEGQQVLLTLANGAPGALATRHAQAALKRAREK